MVAGAWLNEALSGCSDVTSFNTPTQAALEDLKYADVAAATAELSTCEAQQKAAYEVLSALSKLSLTSYL